MINIIHTRLELNHFRSNVSSDKTIGLVPTMGNLHAGHLTLLEKSCSENDISIITIFVNPKQFGPQEDFNHYPRTLEADILKITGLGLNANIIVFAPINDKEIYPNHFSTNISLGPMTQILCGKFRPGHFDGVTTVVYRLFQITKAHNAYFGQKDFQQCVVIKKMVSDLEIPVNIHILPIIRSMDGLALSSRNQYLSDKERIEALHLPNTLIAIEKILNANQNPYELIRQELTNKAWDYLEILDTLNLSTPTQFTTEVVVVGAYRIGTTRLLDNRVVQIHA